VKFKSDTGQVMREDMGSFTTSFSNGEQNCITNSRSLKDEQLKLLNAPSCKNVHCGCPIFMQQKALLLISKEYGQMCL